MVVPFIYDVYITKKIHWKWWEDSEGPIRLVMGRVDVLVSTLVIIYFIDLFFFQSYVIPSLPLEKLFFTGDYLFVSRVNYDPRIPKTPSTIPLTQHILPIINTKSYISRPHWNYRCVKGSDKVRLDDIVVFNFPVGDTIMDEPAYQSNDYYRDICILGTNFLAQQNPNINLSTMSTLQQHALFGKAYVTGRAYIMGNVGIYEALDWRPTDCRENHAKYCVDLLGQTLQTRDKIVYIDGEANKEPEKVEYTYFIKFKNIAVSDFIGECYDELRKDLEANDEDV